MAVGRVPEGNNVLGASRYANNSFGTDTYFAHPATNSSSINARGMMASLTFAFCSAALSAAGKFGVGHQRVVRRHWLVEYYS